MKYAVPALSSASGQHARFTVKAVLLLSIGSIGALALPMSANAQAAHLAIVQSTFADYPANGLSAPYGVATGPAGAIYIADFGNNRVLKETLTPSGYVQSTVSSLAGPRNLAVDGSGNVYVADEHNNRILKEAPSAGGYTETTIVTGLSDPLGIAVDASGNVYIADSGNHRVLKETRSGSAYSQSLVANNFVVPTGVAVDAAGDVYISDSAGGSVVKETPFAGEYSQTLVADSARNGLSYPGGLAVDAGGNLYIADSGNGRVVKETPSAGGYTQSTVGSGMIEPQGTAIDESGNLYIADPGSSLVIEEQFGAADVGSVEVGSQSRVTTLSFTFDSTGTIGAPRVLTQGTAGLDFIDAGSGSCDSNGSSHSYPAYSTCTVNIIFAPRYPGVRQGAVELTSSSGRVLTTAYIYGDGISSQVAFAPPTQSMLFDPSSGLSSPIGLAVDAAGNFYIADSLPGVLEETPSGGGYRSSVIAGPAAGLGRAFDVAVDGAGNVYIADALNSRVFKETLSAGSYTQTTIGYGLNGPEALAVDGAGNIYIADTGNNRVLKETPSAGIYKQSTIPISGLNNPGGIAVDWLGHLYIADTLNNRVVEESPVGATYAQSSIGSGLDTPYRVAVDAAGDVYISDTGNNRILKETASAGGYIQSVLASNGLDQPYGIALDGNGNLYVADTYNARVLKEDTADAPSLSFTATPVGSPSADSPKLVAVENNGNEPLTFPIPAVAGAYNPSVSANFTWVDNVSNACTETGAGAATAFTLAAGTACNLGLDFVPASIGNISGGVTLTDNSLNQAAPGYASQVISLSGVGTAITVTLTPPAGALPEATVGAAYSQTLSATGGAAPYSFLVSSGSLPPGMSLSSSGVLAGAPTTAGLFNFSITVTNASHGSSGSQPYTLAVKKAPAAVTLTGLAATYSGSPIAATVTTKPTGLDVDITYNGSPEAPTVAGDYAVVATVDAQNYSGGASGALVISKATPVISWSTPAAIGNGTPLTAAQLDATATVNGIPTPGNFVYTPAAGTVLAVGTHALSVTFTPADTADYVTPPASVTSITVDQGALSVTADNATRVFGEPNPAFSGTVSGAEGNDSFTETFSTTATRSSSTGSYPIVPSVTGPNLGNYALNVINGALTILQAATTTTLASSASSFTPGQSLTLTANVTDASPGSIGTPNGTVNFYDGTTPLGPGDLVNGTASYTVTSLAAGTTHALRAVYAGDADFTGSTSGSPISMPVTALDFSLTPIGPSSRSVTPGGAASYSVAVSPTSGDYPAQVTFAATGLPSGATAAFSPATIAANGGAATVTITIQTSASSQSALSRRPFQHSAPLALGLVLLPLVGLRRARKTWLRSGAMFMLLVAIGVAAVAPLAGCGTSGTLPGRTAPNSPAQNYTLAVTATSSGIQHSVNVSLSVQ